MPSPAGERALSFPRTGLSAFALSQSFHHYAAPLSNVAEERGLATVLRVAIKEHYGPDSEKLVEFGIQPFRGVTRKPRTPPTSEAPAATLPAD